MQIEITAKGRLASCDCEKCGSTTSWHEWADWGQAEDLKTATCQECGRSLDPETYWESPKRNYYAGRYNMPGYLDCTYWHYGTNKKKLINKLKDFYGE